MASKRVLKKHKSMPFVRLLKMIAHKRQLNHHAGSTKKRGFCGGQEGLVYRARNLMILNLLGINISL